MANVTTRISLPAALRPGGLVALPFPPGRSSAGLNPAAAEAVVAGGTYRAGAGFAVLLDKSGVLFTWQGAHVVPAGAEILLSIPEAADNAAQGLVGAPAASEIAILGDSRAEAETRTSGGGTLITFNARGMLTWANALAGQRCGFDFDSNEGVGGENTAQVLQRVANVIARRPSLCVYFCGTNDPKSEFSISAEQSIANIYATLDALRAAGVQVIVVRDTPRTDAVWAAATTTPVLDVRRRLAAQDAAVLRYARANRGVYVVGVPLNYANIQTGEPQATFAPDGTHPSTLGAYALASHAGGLADLLRSLVPPRQDLWSTYGDTYDAVTHPFGNILPNPRLADIGGAPTAPITGTRPDLWTASRGGAGTLTGTIAMSAETAADGNGDWSVLTATTAVLSTGLAAENVSILATVARPAGIVGGHVLEGMVEISVAASPVRLAGVTLQCNESDGSGTTIDYNALENSDGFASWPPDALSLVLRTPRILVRPATGSGSRQFIWRVIARFDNAGAAPASFVMKFRRPSLRRIA